MQGYVDELNRQWENEQRERVAIVWSWDECISYLNSFPPLQRWYYEDVIQVRGAADLDEMILRTISMAFARPAFEVPLHCETPDEFMQALRDTQKALRTGELVDRESRHVIRKAVGGYNELDDGHNRAGLQRVDEALKQLRSKIEQGLKDNAIGRVNGFLDFHDSALANDLEEIRRRCLQELNEVLRRAGLPPI